MSIVPADLCDCPIFNSACFNVPIVPSGGGTTVQGGLISSMVSATGTVTFPTPYSAQPQVVLTLNLNGGLVHIPVAVSSFVLVGSSYTGFNWSSATTSAISTISWISIQ
jgi:hypothetical protein